MYASHVAMCEQVWKGQSKRTDGFLCACVYICLDFILDLFTKITPKKFTQKTLEMYFTMSIIAADFSSNHWWATHLRYTG